MKIFVIVLDKQGESVKEEVYDRLKNKNVKFYRISSATFILKGEYLSGEVAEIVGIKGDDRLKDASGVVFRIDSYSGFADPSIWEFLGD